MKKSEKNKILQMVALWNDSKLEEEYYKAVYDCLGSQTEEMYELGYDISDILEQEKYEKYLCDYADMLEYVCIQRGIELWKEENVKRRNA